MKKQKSLIAIIQLSSWILSSMLVIVLGSLWVNAELNQAKLHQESIQKSLLDRQKTAIQADIKHVITHIDYMRNQLQQRVKRRTQARTEEAYQTALYLYEQNKENKSLSEIAELIHDALYAASWDDGRGYYFAEDMQGNERVNRNNPDLEGQNIINLQDSNGKYFVQEILNIARSEKREGFCTYFWNRPDTPDVLVSKISYIKYFEPLDWVIGTGIYLDDEEKKIKQEVVNWIDKVRFDDSEYIFAGTFEGISLSGPAKGKNMWEATDPNGTKLVQQLIERAAGGGGFVEYVMPKLEGQRPSPKLSYAAPIPNWQWYIGTGVYIDYIEDEIAKEQEITKKALQKILTQIVLVLCLFLFVSLSFTWLLAGKLKRNLTLFLDFFQKSAAEKLTIPPNKVSFREFRSLALSANQMAEDRQQAWEELNTEQERLAVTLQSIGDGVMTTDT
ncbi:MAG: cache domain-containing protein, partial [Desulfuromonadales bacterium]|nr:cache domain-containing protein [Desulfuromonadales bacterium]